MRAHLPECVRAGAAGRRETFLVSTSRGKGRAEPTERPREQATGGHCLPKHGAMSLFALVVEKAAGQTGKTGQFDVVHAHKVTQIYNKCVHD